MEPDQKEKAPEPAYRFDCREGIVSIVMDLSRLSPASAVGHLDMAKDTIKGLYQQAMAKQQAQKIVMPGDSIFNKMRNFVNSK